MATINVSAIMPAVVLALTGIFIMAAEPFVRNNRKRMLGWLALAGTAVATLALIPMSGARG